MSVAEVWGTHHLWWGGREPAGESVCVLGMWVPGPGALIAALGQGQPCLRHTPWPSSVPGKPTAGPGSQERDWACGLSRRANDSRSCSHSHPLSQWESGERGCDCQKGHALSKEEGPPPVSSRVQECDMVKNTAVSSDGVIFQENIQIWISLCMYQVFIY